MNFIASASTDIGIRKNINQDSYGLKILSTRLGNIVAAILCDGMGGHQCGEIASATVVDAFEQWILTRLPVLCNEGINDTVINNEWSKLIYDCNRKLRSFGQRKAVEMGVKECTVGTTATILMITPTRYFVMNVGDSRAYEITDKAIVLTKDQTLIAKEIELGHITPEAAKTDPRRSILLYAIGGSDVIVPDMYCGRTRKGAVYMLCSDGFRHEITAEEIQRFLDPSAMHDAEHMKQSMDSLINLNKMRKEDDNITVVSIKTY